MNRKQDLKKVVVVGTGFVGMSAAYSMLNSGGGIDELVLIDMNKEKAIGEAMDLSHGLPYVSSQMKIRAGDYDECANANIVVITAGLAQKPGQTRLELTQTNAKIMIDITDAIMGSGFNDIIIVASNPVDIMSYVVYKASGLPANRVIGSGTILDTARLRYLISEYLDVSSSNVHAYILGEHGDSSFVPWMNTYIGAKNLMEYMIERNENMNELHNIYKGVQQAAYEIISKKQATYYGIGLALNRLVRAILNDENAIFTVSCYLNGEYHQKDVYIGVPTIVNADGIKEIIPLHLNGVDQKKFDNSANTLKTLIQKDIDPLLK